MDMLKIQVFTILNGSLKSPVFNTDFEIFWVSLADSFDEVPGGSDFSTGDFTFLYFITNEF
jgi:hypothetical protein